MENKDMEYKYQLHKNTCIYLNDLYISKNKEYGDSFGKAFDDLGVISAITEIYHKTQRLVNIYNKDNLTFESIEDTLLDLANYAIMTLVELKERENEDFFSDTEC